MIAPEQHDEGGALRRMDRRRGRSVRYQVPAGAAANVVVHTEHRHHFAVIRRIPPRGNSWMSYVFAEGR